MTQPIVVAVSQGDEAHAAVALGAGVARVLEAPLVLGGVAVIPAPGGAMVVPGWSPASDPGDLRGRVARRLRALAEDVSPEVECSVHVVGATGIVPGLEMIVDAERAEMLVVGASHLGRIARAFRGDVALGAARHVPCAVLTVPAGGVPPAWSPEIIGIAWDGTAEADAGLEDAISLAERCGAVLRVLRVNDSWDVLAAAGAADPASMQKTVDEVDAQARRELEDVVARVGRRVRCESKLLHGPAAGELIRAAVGLDLLVVGPRRQRAAQRILLGSVSSWVAQRAPCPVLVAPLRTVARVTA